MWTPYPGPLANGSGPLLMGARIWSPQLRNHRQVLVALPPSYLTSDRRYPVLYLQDGQNLFDPTTSFAGHWRLGESLAEQAQRGVELIVVGVSHGEKRRIAEYSPFVDRKQGGGQGRRYVTWLADALKARIDADFRTLPGAESSAIGGSSMGGLISLYALFARRETFGTAAALSPALWFAGGAIFDYVRSHEAPGGRAYLDVGTGEGEGAVADVRRARDLLVEQGFRLGDTLGYVEDPEARHEESAWGRRLAAALPFLIGAGPAPQMVAQSSLEGQRNVAT